MSYQLLCPFWIDTEGYSDRDRIMFCAGHEFANIIKQLNYNKKIYQAYILKENESRIRLAANHFNRLVIIEDHDSHYSHLTILSE